MKNNKVNLINFLIENKGKPHQTTWLDLANKFNIKPSKSDTQRTKATNDIWRSYKKKKGSSFDPTSTSAAKVLILDIETTPLSSYVWRLWNQNVNHKNGQLRSDSYFMLTWVAKWLFDDNYITAKLSPSEAKREDDYRITKQMWNLLEEADIIIAHNAIKFDIRQMNARFIKHGLGLPTPYLVIDTLLHSRKKFDLPSQSLDFLGRFLGVGQKVETGGFELWARCMKGEAAALQEMLDYNIQDVALLEEVYLKMRPYIQPHPAMGIFIQDDVERCPTCGSDDLTWTGTYRTYVNAFDACRCNSCGSIGRSRKTNIDKEVKKNLLVSTPK